jgi:hypothetical protein
MNKIFTIFLLIVITACSDDYELQKSIFVSDPQAPGLPKYSEWGYNTFGAYYDRGAVISNDRDYPMKVISENGNTKFVLQGKYAVAGNYYYPSYQDEDLLSLQIEVTNLSFERYQDLISLHKSEYDLAESEIVVTITRDKVEYACEVLIGSFNINHAKKLFVDGMETEVILSGFFELKLKLNGMPISITAGRFDVGVGENNFFSL